MKTKQVIEFVTLGLVGLFFVNSQVFAYGLTGFNWYSEIPFNGSGHIEYDIDLSGFTNRAIGLTDEQTNAAILGAFDQWHKVSNVAFQPDTIFTDQDVIIEWANLNNAYGIADPNNPAMGNWGTDPSLNLLHIILNSDPLYSWSNIGTGSNNSVDIQAVVLHELGHVLGLAHTDEKEYNNENSVDHGNNNTAMYSLSSLAHDLALSDDDIFGIRWLYGGNLASTVNSDSLVNAAFGNVNPAKPPLLTETVAHEGPNDWLYQGTIGKPGVDFTEVHLDAWDVTSAVALIDPGLWKSTILSDEVIFRRQGGYTGRFLFDLTSNDPSGRITWQTYADNLEAGVTYGPVRVSEPGTLILFLSSLGMLIYFQQRGKARS